MANPEPETNPVNLRYLILRYIVVMVLPGILLAVVDVLVQYLFQYQSGAGRQKAGIDSRAQPC
tara:strand:- start:14648 stop:14836 length:189 start_codon:yes stop_codon:yes gene_type:complete